VRISLDQLHCLATASWAWLSSSSSAYKGHSDVVSNTCGRNQTKFKEPGQASRDVLRQQHRVPCKPLTVAIHQLHPAFDYSLHLTDGLACPANTANFNATGLATNPQGGHSRVSIQLQSTVVSNHGVRTKVISRSLYGATDACVIAFECPAKPLTSLPNHSAFDYRSPANLPDPPGCPANTRHDLLPYVPMCYSSAAGFIWWRFAPSVLPHPYRSAITGWATKVIGAPGRR